MSKQNNVATRVAQCFEQRRIDLVILAFPFRIQLGDVGAGPSDETLTEVLCRRCVHEKETSLLKAMSAKQRSKCGPVAGNGDSSRIAENLLRRL
jgi:hypothetical protein